MFFEKRRVARDHFDGNGYYDLPTKYENKRSRILPMEIIDADEVDKPAKKTKAKTQKKAVKAKPITSATILKLEKEIKTMDAKIGKLKIENATLKVERDKHYKRAMELRKELKTIKNDPDIKALREKQADAAILRDNPDFLEIT
jgi:predicted RNase H-like nuclease (RuvC/YqgF family)